MNLTVLKTAPMGDLMALAQENRVEGVARLRREEIIFALLKAHARKGEDIYDSEVFEFTVKKSRRRTKSVPVLKLTQVGEMNILRRSRERS